MTDLARVAALLSAKAWLVVLLAVFVVGIMLGRWSNRPTPVAQASIDSMRVASAALDQQTALQVLLAVAFADSMHTRHAAAAAKDSADRAALHRRKRPTTELAQETVTAPDTCKAILDRYVEQLAIRDSIHDIDSAALLRADSAIRAWDRTAARLAFAAIAEQQSRHNAERLAEQALKSQRPPRLELQGEVFSVLPTPRVSVGATGVWHLGKGWQATGGYQAAIGEAGRWQVGLRKTVRIL